MVKEQEEAKDVTMDFYTASFAFVGVLAVANWMFITFRSLFWVTYYNIVEQLNPEKYCLEKRFGQWAVITGATDGIGREYARGLAKRRINVILISRTESKLLELCSEIKLKYGVKAKYIVADFTRGAPIYANIEKTLQEFPVGILVNNVGVAVEYPDELHRLPKQILWDTVNVNVAACTILTRIVAPGMVERGRGAIVNISSGSEMQPTPYMNIYSASKAYIRMLTLAIERELSPHGVAVQLVSPMFLVTKLNRFSTTLQAGGLFIPDVETYTAAALNKLGKTARTNGYFMHSIQYAVINMVPEWIRTLVGERLGKQFYREYWEQQRK